MKETGDYLCHMMVMTKRTPTCGVTIQPPGGVDLDVGVTRLRGRLCNLATCSHRGVAHRNTPK